MNLHDFYQSDTETLEALKNQLELELERREKEKIKIEQEKKKQAWDKVVEVLCQYTNVYGSILVEHYYEGTTFIDGENDFSTPGEILLADN